MGHFRKAPKAIRFRGFDGRGKHRFLRAINYRHRIVFIKWLGTHRDYDKIDVKTVKYGHQAH